jgi:hypothetical protein
VLDQYLGPGFLTAALGLVFAAFTLNRKDAREAVETADVNIKAAMARAAEAEAREAEVRARLRDAEAENDRLHRLLREHGVQS